MTKTLTDKWRDGTLPAGYYYIIANTKARNEVIFYLPENTHTDGAVIKGEVVNGEDGGWVVEVLAPVPSYNEWQAELASNDKLLTVQKRLEKAKRALCEASRMALSDETDISKIYDIVHPVICELNEV